jgi:hypothetical protein
MAYVEAKAEKKATPKSKFPHIHNSGQAVIANLKITFSYLDSYSSPVTKTLPILNARSIARIIRARLNRFHGAPPGSRESDEPHIAEKKR